MLKNGTPLYRTRTTIYVIRSSLSLIHVPFNRRFNHFYKTAYEAKKINRKQQIFIKLFLSYSSVPMLIINIYSNKLGFPPFSPEKDLFL